MEKPEWAEQAGLMTCLIYLMGTFELEWAFSGSRWVALMLPLKASAALGLWSRDVTLFFAAVFIPQGLKGETIQRTSSCRQSKPFTNETCDNGKLHCKCKLLYSVALSP